MVGVCVCYGIVGIFTTIFFCVPVSGFWNPSPTDRCISKEGLWLSHSAMNIVTDVIIFLIPVPTVLKLSKHKSIPSCGPESVASPLSQVAWFGPPRKVTNRNQI